MVKMTSLQISLDILQIHYKKFRNMCIFLKIWTIFRETYK